MKRGVPASFLTRWNWAQNNKLTSPKMGHAISWPGLLCNLHFLNLAALLWSCAPVFWTLLLLYFRIPLIIYLVSIISYGTGLELLVPHFSAVVSSELLRCFRNNLRFYRNIWKHDGFEKTLLVKKFLGVKISETHKEYKKIHCSGSSKEKRSCWITLCTCCSLAGKTGDLRVLLMPQGEGS